MCCKICGMGPCRLTKDGRLVFVEQLSIRFKPEISFDRLQQDAAAHSDHGRDMAFTLKAVANGETEGYIIRDVAKLRICCFVLWYSDRKTDHPMRSPMIWQIYILRNLANSVERWPQLPAAPEKRQKLWEDQGVWPRGIDREVVEALTPDPYW